MRHRHYRQKLISATYTYRGGNLVCKWRDCVSGFENWGSSWVMKLQQMETLNTGSKASSPEILFNIYKSFFFLKSHHFGKCSHIILLYILGYNMSWNPATSPTPRIDAYAYTHQAQDD